MVFMEVYGVSQLEGRMLLEFCLEEEFDGVYGGLWCKSVRGRMLLEFCLEEEFDGVHGGLWCKSVRRKNVTRVLPGGRI